MKKTYTFADVWYHGMRHDGCLWGSNNRYKAGGVFLPKDYDGIEVSLTEVIKALRDQGYTKNWKHCTADVERDDFAYVVYVYNAKGDEMFEVRITAD